MDETPSIPDLTEETFRAGIIEAIKTALGMGLLTPANIVEAVEDIDPDDLGDLVEALSKRLVAQPYAEIVAAVAKALDEYIAESEHEGTEVTAADFGLYLNIALGGDPVDLGLTDHVHPPSMRCNVMCPAHPNTVKGDRHG